MYAAHFGLTELPFRPLPDARFLVDSPQQRAALSVLTAAVERGEPVMLLSGPWGTGKTLLAQRLVAALDASKVHAACMLGGGRGGEALMRGIAVAFGVPLDDVVAPAAGLIEAIEQHGRSGRRMLLVLDEAQDLDADALRRLHALTEIRVAGRPVFQVCLVGAAAPTDLGPATPVALLGPLSREETQAYVVQRLQNAGWDARPGLDHEALAEIHRRTGGVPREINRLAHRMLVDLYRSGEGRMSVATVGAAADALQAEDGMRPVAPPPPTDPVPPSAPADAGAAPPSAERAAPEPMELADPEEPQADLDEIMAAVTGPHPQPAFVSRWGAAASTGAVTVGYPIATTASTALQTLPPPDAANDEAPARRRGMPLAAMAVAFALAAAGLVWLLAGGRGELGPPGAAPAAAVEPPTGPRAVTATVEPAARAEPPPAIPAEPTASGCTASARSLGLCGAPPAPATAPATPPPAAAPAPAPAARAAPCEGPRAALGLCTER